MLATASDPKVWEQHPVSDRYKEPVFREYFDGAIACASSFAFVENNTGKIIGSCRFYGFDADKSEIEIGWTFLGRDYWGGTYNREIKQLLLEHAFRFVQTVVFWVGEDNIRSRRAMEKIGGILRDGVHYRELSGDDPYVMYEIRKG